MSKHKGGLLRTCPACGKEIKKSRRVFCPHCGVNMYEYTSKGATPTTGGMGKERQATKREDELAKICPACGARISDLSRTFCPNCGVNIYEYAGIHNLQVKVVGAGAGSSRPQGAGGKTRKPRLQKWKGKAREALGLDTEDSLSEPVAGLEGQRRQAKRTVNKYVAVAGGTAVVTAPIPGTSIALTGIEAKMVYDVARAYGLQLSMKEAATLVALLLSASAPLKGVVEASAAVPVLGWVAQPAIACGVCKALGAAAIRYFEDRLEDEVEDGEAPAQLAVFDRGIDISVPPEEVFAYIETPSSMLNIWPSLVEITEIDQLPSGAAGCQWVYDMAGVRLDGIGELVDHVPSQRIAASTRGGIEGTIAWLLDTAGPGTAVAFKAEYALPRPVLAKTGRDLVIRQNEREIDFALAKLKIDLES